MPGSWRTPQPRRREAAEVVRAARWISFIGYLGLAIYLAAHLPQHGHYTGHRHTNPTAGDIGIGGTLWLLVGLPFLYLFVSAELGLWRRRRHG